MPLTPCAATPHPSPFLERLILLLLPYFLPVSPDEAIARAEILETLASYGGRTRSEVINAARIIAFSFAALDTLAEAKAPGLSPSLRLRRNGCANNLNRSCQQNEQSLACDLPDALPPNQEPDNDLSNFEFYTAIEHTEASIAAHYDRLWGEAMMTVLAEPGMPVQPVRQAVTT